MQNALNNDTTNVVEITKTYLQNIAENQHLNAFIEVYSDEVLEQARLVDEKLANCSAGKLAGMVVGIKDNLCYKNHKVSASSKILDGFRSTYSATVVKRLIEEDAIILNALKLYGFVDPEMGDFRLRLGSPAVDAGNFEWVGALPLDYGGVNRAHDAGPDLGVYEGAVDAVNLGGNITYSGEVDTGPFRVWLMDQSGIKVKQLEMGAAGPYSFVVQRGFSYKVKAFRDAANDGWPSEGDPWDYHAHYPIEINESRSDFHVHLQDALPEQNATVSGEVFYEGPVPGPVVVWVLDGHSIVREQILPEGEGEYSFTLPKGEAYEILAFKDGNENGELDDEWQVGEPAAMYGVLNESSQTFESEVFVGGDLTDLDIEISHHGDHDEDGITDWEEYVAGLNGGSIDPEPVEPLDDLIAEYLLDGNATDSSLYENHGVVFGAVPGTNRFGREGMALFFDGEDDHVQLPPMELGREYTMAVCNSLPIFVFSNKEVFTNLCLCRALAFLSFRLYLLLARPCQRLCLQQQLHAVQVPVLRGKHERSPVDLRRGKRRQVSRRTCAIRITCQERTAVLRLTSSDPS